MGQPRRGAKDRRQPPEAAEAKGTVPAGAPGGIRAAHRFRTSGLQSSKAADLGWLLQPLGTANMKCERDARTVLPLGWNGPRQRSGPWDGALGQGSGLCREPHTSTLSVPSNIVGKTDLRLSSETPFCSVPRVPASVTDTAAQPDVGSPPLGGVFLPPTLAPSPSAGPVDSASKYIPGSTCPSPGHNHGLASCSPRATPAPANGGASRCHVMSRPLQNRQAAKVPDISYFPVTFSVTPHVTHSTAATRASFLFSQPWLREARCPPAPAHVPPAPAPSFRSRECPASWRPSSFPYLGGWPPSLSY